MNRNGTKITARQRRLIEALLAGQNISQACKTAGVGRRTYYRWMKLAHFADALQEAETELLTGLMRRLLGMTEGAADALGEIVADRRLPAARLQAARAILDNLVRLRNTVELENRLAELERKVREINHENDDLSAQTD